MRMRSIAAVLVLFFTAVSSAAPIEAEAEIPDSTVYLRRDAALENAPFEVCASAMSLIEAETGTVIFEKAPDEPLPMASTTKIMTALVVSENCRLEDMVEVPDEAVGTEGSSMHLVKGERITVEDLLYGLMLASGNDAAVALAYHTAGSAEAFADMMNEKADRLGLIKTHFVTPNGLSAEGHMTTAYELCLISREALRDPVVSRIVSTQYHTTTSGAYQRTFKNKNALLWDYEGAVGIKTGYTAAAGRCLAFAAERDGMMLIGVLLNCRPMFETAARLMDFAFENYTLCTVVERGQSLGLINVDNGIQKVLAVEAKDSIITVVRKGRSRSFDAETEFYPVSAPFPAGGAVGVIRLLEDGRAYAVCPVTASHAVEERDLLFWLRLLLSSFFQRPSQDPVIGS